MVHIDIGINIEKKRLCWMEVAMTELLVHIDIGINIENEIICEMEVAMTELLVTIRGTGKDPGTPSLHPHCCQKHPYISPGKLNTQNNLKSS